MFARETTASQRHRKCCSLKNRNPLPISTFASFYITEAHCRCREKRKPENNFFLCETLSSPARHPCKCCDYLPLLIYANSSARFRKLDARHTLVVIMSHRQHNEARTENYFSHDIKQLDSNWKTKKARLHRTKTFKFQQHKKLFLFVQLLHISWSTKAS